MKTSAASRSISLAPTADDKVIATKPEAVGISEQPRRYHIDEVDMPDKEIREIIRKAWGLDNIDLKPTSRSPSEKELAEFLAEIKWDSREK